MHLALSGRELPELVRLSVRRKWSSRGDTSFQRGPWLLLLRMFTPIRIGMVWPSLVIRPKQNFRPSFMDAHRTRMEIRTGTTQRVCDHWQPGVWWTTSILPCSSQRALKRLLHSHLFQKGDAGFAELLESTMIARTGIHQGRTMRTISRKKKVCWVHSGYPRQFQQVLSSPLWQILNHR